VAGLCYRQSTTNKCAWATGRERWVADAEEEEEEELDNRHRKIRKGGRTTSGAKGFTLNAPPTALGEEFSASERAL
jgi:hypothetical protein